MDKLVLKNTEAEYIAITKMLLKGMTISKIASNLNYSESTVSNRLSYLFQKYKAKNRMEFIYNFLSKIIQKYKSELKKLNVENENLKKYVEDIKTIILKAQKNSVSDNNCLLLKETEF